MNLFQEKNWKKTWGTCLSQGKARWGAKHSPPLYESTDFLASGKNARDNRHMQKSTRSCEARNTYKNDKICFKDFLGLRESSEWMS